MRVKSSVQKKERKKKVMQLASGFRGRKKNCYGLAIDMIRRKLKYQYRDRRRIKREMRKLWIIRINAGARKLGTTYSKLMNCLKEKKVDMNRKMLSDMASRHFDSFKKIVQSNCS